MGRGVCVCVKEEVPQWPCGNELGHSLSSRIVYGRLVPFSVYLPYWDTDEALLFWVPWVTFGTHTHTHTHLLKNNMNSKPRNHHISVCIDIIHWIFNKLYNANALVFHREKNWLKPKKKRPPRLLRLPQPWWSWCFPFIMQSSICSFPIVACQE